jgi:hypothetical protein
MYKKLMVCALMTVLMVVTASALDTRPAVHQAINGPVSYSPVPMDTQEDVIAYDSAPAVYWPDLLQVGTKFAVRFTPPQPCSLSYIQVVSYNGSGNALIHITDDNGGVPGTDLITPFTANLAGNIQYQTIDLPENIDVGTSDFHIMVEYTQAPPPFITGDSDGATENRSRYKTPSGSWTNLSADINFRAWVIFYGDDQVAPTIDHVPQVLGFSYDTDHALSAAITDASGVASADIHYSLDGSTWETTPMTDAGDDIWQGAIPHQPAGATVLYYLSAVDASANSNEGFDPPTAPGVPYVMNIVLGSEIAYDDGEVNGWWIVSDTYDDNAFAIRMTPPEYPAQVLMARAYVSDDTPFDFTINAVSAGQPGDVLPGGEELQGIREPHGWAISEWPGGGPTIDAGHFFLLFHWRPSTPSDPAVGQDDDNIFFRSYWHTTAQGWQMVADGEYMMRTIVATPTGIKELDGNGSRPASYQLIGNYPNPFNPSTDIKFLAPEPGNVRIEIYNVAGQLVKVVLDEMVQPGVKAVTWDGTNENGEQVNSGIYFSRMIAGNTAETQKMVLMK